MNPNQNQLPPQNTIPPQQEQIPANQPPAQVAPPANQQNTVQKQTPVQASSAVTEEVAVPQNQNVVAADNTPGQFSYVYIICAVVALASVVFFWKRILEWLKHGKTISLPAEDDGTICPTCGGKGKVTKHKTTTVPCGHCKSTGNDSCHFCGGTGRNGLGIQAPYDDIENYPKCDYCEGSGFSAPRKMCCMCKGARKQTFSEPYEVECPTCKGSGRK